MELRLDTNRAEIGTVRRVRGRRSYREAITAMTILQTRPASLGRGDAKNRPYAAVIGHCAGPSGRSVKAAFKVSPDVCRTPAPRT